MGQVPLETMLWSNPRLDYLSVITTWGNVKEKAPRLSEAPRLPRRYCSIDSLGRQALTEKESITSGNKTAWEGEGSGQDERNQQSLTYRFSVPRGKPPLAIPRHGHTLASKSSGTNGRARSRSLAEEIAS
jgi:hypothetical protein